MSPSCFIIAEAGVNHCGDIAKARKMVEVAAQAGADAIKFQTFKATALTVSDAPKAEYQKLATDNSESQQSMLSKLELTESEHLELFDYCAQLGIEFMSTGFDTESLGFLIDMGISRIKVPSGEITNLPLLRYVAGVGLPVILSTGMSNLEEIQQAVNSLVTAGMNKRHIVVLHCNTAYPTPMSDVNLACLGSMRHDLGVEIGYSDHTLGDEIAIAAVALGSVVIEKHFTLDRTLPGPDQASSLEPQELDRLVRRIRHVELARGDGIKRATPSEAMNIAIARKSLVASTSIAKGELFSEYNITAKRPGTGISPMHWDDVIGQASQRDYLPDETIEI